MSILIEFNSIMSAYAVLLDVPDTNVGKIKGRL
nr:MAG TPA: hypothetical protein [Caudoviricetes sp.]